jgi:ribosomal protein L37AE/L43A
MVNTMVKETAGAYTPGKRGFTLTLAVIAAKAQPSGVPDCPACLRTRLRRPERTVGFCRLCCRWQYLEQAGFAAFAGLAYRHLSCVACAGSTWCQNVELRPEGEACAQAAHVHPVGACPIR